jgi:hypothetical protein
MKKGSKHTEKAKKKIEISHKGKIFSKSEKAHREFHQKYGKYNNNKSQLDKFLNQ